MPDGCAYLWKYYGELQGAEPLAFVEIEAWSRLTNLFLQPWEILAIKKLDQIFREIIHGRFRNSKAGDKG